MGELFDLLVGGPCACGEAVDDVVALGVQLPRARVEIDGDLAVRGAGDGDDMAVGHNGRKKARRDYCAQIVGSTCVRASFLCPHTRASFNAVQDAFSSALCAPCDRNRDRDCDRPRSWARLSRSWAPLPTTAEATPLLLSLRAVVFFFVELFDVSSFFLLMLRNRAPAAPSSGRRRRDNPRLISPRK